MEKSNVVDIKVYKYTKIAKEFVRIREKDPTKASEYAKSVVSKDEYSDLAKYIELELVRREGL